LAVTVGFTDEGIPLVAHKYGLYLKVEPMNELLKNSGGDFSVVEIFRPDHPEGFDEKSKLHKFDK